MSWIGQPESYSDVLKRIFAATLTVGVLCTFAVAAVSPDVRTFLESWNAQTSIGIFDSVKALYVVIPLFVAILARVFLLHDRVSDLLGIRRRFDLQNILRPLAEGVGLPTVGEKWERIEADRDLAMTRTFYRYASFKDPKIDVQLVRTAADRWAWFWCCVEPVIILLIAGSIFVVLRAWLPFFAILVGVAVLALVSLSLWPQLRRGAQNQVAEILNNEEWKAEVRSALGALTVGTGYGGEFGSVGEALPKIRKKPEPTSGAPRDTAPSSGSYDVPIRTIDTPRRLRVFLCHASEDKADVRRIYAFLVASGIDVWLDEENLLPGQDWELEIRKAIKERDVIVACLSTQAVTKTGFVQKEIRLALDAADERPEGTIFVLPLRLDDCRVPDRLSHLHWVDVFFTGGHDKLVSALRQRAEDCGAFIGEQPRATGTLCPECNEPMGPWDKVCSECGFSWDKR